MAPTDDVTTACGTCNGYARLQMLKQHRHYRHHDHHHQEQQQQHQHHHETQTDCSQGLRELNPNPSDQSHKEKHSGWGNRSGHTFLVTLFVTLTLLTRITFTTAQGAMRFVVEPRNRTVAEGGTVVFNCSIEHIKGPVTWAQQGFAMGIDRELGAFPRYSMLGTTRGSVSEYNLQIQDVVLEEDEANYECQVNPSQDSQGMRSQKAYLIVVVPPERPIILNGSVIQVVLNRPSKIMCAANNGRPAPSITWHIDGERMTQNVSVLSTPHGLRINATGVLSLTASMAHNGKRIECQAYTQFMRSPYRTFATLDVQYLPNLTFNDNITASRSLKEHDFVHFECFGIANPPITSWKWYKDNVIIVNATSNTYNTPAIGPDYNNVVISCEATNSVGSTRFDKTLNVEFGPRITQITSVVGADEGQRAELTCIVDGNPAPSVIWRRKDRSRKSHHMLSTKNTYSIKHVNSGSFGWYVCTAAVIGFPDTSKEAMLLRNDRPKPQSEKRQLAEKGERGTLECLVNSIPKPRLVKWSKDKKDLDTEIGRYRMVQLDMLYGIKTVLVIQSVQSSDFGFYNCTVENEYGTSFDEIELAEKYSVPTTYIIIGIIGGFAVIFVIILVCVLYRRYKKDDQGSVLDNVDTAKTGSYTDTDSSSDKKREKADSPSTLMGQFRQGYTKDVYRFSADYDDMPYKEQTKGNNNGYGFIEPYESYSDHPIYDGEYVQGVDEPIPSDRFDSLYSTGTGPGFNMSSFRANNFDSTPPPTMTRITPLHMNNSKLATDV